jgi:hypothetical protein
VHVLISVEQIDVRRMVAEEAGEDQVAYLFSELLEVLKMQARYLLLIDYLSLVSSLSF